MPRGPRAETKRWGAQKGAQYEATLGRGCAWYAGQSTYYIRYPSGCTSAGRLIEGSRAEHLLADKGYDSDAIVEQARRQGMEVQIPPRKNRKEQRAYDKHLYKLRHLVENAFLHLKRWRGIATRYAKRSDSFLAAVQIRCLVLWAGIS
jgi:transposase